MPAVWKWAGVAAVVAGTGFILRQFGVGPEELLFLAAVVLVLWFAVRRGLWNGP